MKDKCIRRLGAAETFAPKKLSNFLVVLETTQTTDDVWNLVVNLARSLGLPIVDYVYATDFRNWERAQFIRTTVDSKWLDYVRKFPHIRQTSNFRMHGCKHLTPILIGPEYIDQMGDISEDKRRHILLGAKMGLNAGVAFPLRMGEPGQAGTISFGGPQTRAEFDVIAAQHGWTLHAAALAAHTRYTELFKAEFMKRNELTTKQRELITLVGQGLMDKQIAHQLGISFSAVRQRISSVQAKTGAQNRADLAALAMRLGLVSDPMLKGYSDDLTVFLVTGDGKTGSEVRKSAASVATAAE